MNNIFFAKKRSLRKFFNQLFLISPHQFSCRKSNDFCGAPLKLHWNLIIPAEISPFFFFRFFSFFGLISAILSSVLRCFLTFCPLKKNIFSLKFFMRARWKISAGFPASRRNCAENPSISLNLQHKINWTASLKYLCEVWILPLKFQWAPLKINSAKLPHKIFSPHTNLHGRFLILPHKIQHKISHWN